MIEVRRANERGGADHGWLNTRHTFSFANYYDPRHMGFRSLRVINEDRVAPGAGFPPHGHRDMEILSYVLGGALEHRDSMGTGSVIRPGEVQVMSAGTGVRHSEYNASDSEELHFLQIWILPHTPRLTPHYDQRVFSTEERQGKLRLVASPDEADGSVRLNQDVRLYSTLLEPGESVSHELAPGRHAWIQVARGAVKLGAEPLNSGDGAAVSDVSRITLEGVEPAEVLVFDLA